MIDVAKTPPLKRFMQHLRKGEKLLLLKTDGTLREVVKLEYDRKHRRVNYEPGPEFKISQEDRKDDGNG